MCLTARGFKQHVSNRQSRPKDISSLMRQGSGNFRAGQVAEKKDELGISNGMLRLHLTDPHRTLMPKHLYRLRAIIERQLPAYMKQSLMN